MGSVTSRLKTLGAEKIAYQSLKEASSQSTPHADPQAYVSMVEYRVATHEGVNTYWEARPAESVPQFPARFECRPMEQRAEIRPNTPPAESRRCTRLE